MGHPVCEPESEKKSKSRGIEWEKKRKLIKNQGTQRREKCETSKSSPSKFYRNIKKSFVISQISQTFIIRFVLYCFVILLLFFCHIFYILFTHITIGFPMEPWLIKQFLSQSQLGLLPPPSHTLRPSSVLAATIWF